MVGDIFGEVGLLYNCKRTASVISKSNCNIATLSSRNFEILTHKFPEVVSLIKEGCWDYDDPWKRYLVSLLCKVIYFKHISDETLEELHYMLKPEYFEAGQLIFKHSESIDKIYLVIQGEIDMILNYKE